MWSAKIGFPHIISDAEVEVDLPSNLDGTVDTMQFPNRPYLLAMITLARLTSHIMKLIYGRSSQSTSLSGRVQSAFRDLSGWNDKLPDALKVSRGSKLNSDPKACALQLLFNQVWRLALRA